MANTKVIRRVRLISTNGLHLRPAKLLSENAQRFACEISVSCGDRIANAKSILELFALAAKHGSVLVFEARGRNSIEALDCLESLILTAFPIPEKEQNQYETRGV